MQNLRYHSLTLVKTEEAGKGVGGNETWRRWRAHGMLKGGPGPPLPYLVRDGQANRLFPFSSGGHLEF